MRTAYFILGMHRSGTSALASTIDSLGITLGESLLPASNDNPRGYFENKAVQEFNESLLVNRGHGWDDVFFDLSDINEFDYRRLVDSAKRILEKEFGVFDEFAVKDPRLCLLLPIWLDACRQLDIEPKVILTHRHPLEIAQSLKKRNGMSINNALALWADYMFKAEIYSRSLERILVSYDALLNDFESTASSIVAFAGKENLSALESKSAVDKSLRHHKTKASKLSEAPVSISDLLNEYETGTLSSKTIDAAMREFSSLKGFFFNAARTSLYQQVFDERRKYKALKDDYFNKLKASEKSVTAKESEIDNITKEIEKQKADKKNLIESIQQRDERIRNETDKKKKISQELDSLRIDLNKLELSSHDKEMKVERLQSEFDRLLESKQKQLELTEKEVSTLDGRVKELKVEVSERDARIRSELEKNKLLEKEVSQLTHESRKTELLSIQQQQKFEEALAKTDQLNNDLSTKKLENKALVEKIDKLSASESELIAANKALIGDIAELDNKIADTQAEIDDLNQKYKEALSHGEMINGQLLERDTEIEKQRHKVKSLERKLLDLEADRGATKKALTEASKARELFEQKNTQLTDLNTALLSQVHNLEVSVNSVDSCLTDWIDTVVSPLSSLISDNRNGEKGISDKWKTLLFSRRLENAFIRFDNSFAVVKQLPASFIANFDESGYFTCNEDVEVAVDSGEFKSALDHFLKFGFQETMDGKRKLHPKGPFFNPESVKSKDKKDAFISYLSDFYQTIAKRQEKVNSIVESTKQHSESPSVDVDKHVPEKSVVTLPQAPQNLERRPAPNYIRALTLTPSVDIILPVYNALDDVKACVESLYANQTIPFNLIVIDDCSEYETQSWLESAQKDYGFTLSRNTENMRFTKTVNRGFAKSKGDYVVLLNSDTIVTEYWLEKILCCFQSDNTTGIVGPLSNAASWQTVPVREDKVNGGWLVNEIPEGYSIDLLGQLIETISQRQYPNVPSVNGFCYVIKRDVINEIGTLDEEYFPTGYGEEDDFSIRARKAGFSIRVADDTYVFHAKSKSYTKEVRKVLTVGGRKSLDKKHGKEEIENLIAAWKAESLLPQIGKDIESYMHVSSGNRKVVFTAIFGNYDNLKTPEYINPDWDYVCFTDNRAVESDVFQVKHVNPRFDNVTKNARMVKLLSHLFLINYDYSLWIDGSVKLRGKNINDLITDNLASDYISLHNHIKRDCVYEEADACMMAKKDGTEILAQQIAAYKNDGLPEESGIFETAEIARDHRAVEVSMLNSLWWQQLDAFSIRDQVALPYVFWKHDFKNNVMDGVQWLDAYFHMYKHKSGQRKLTLGVELIVAIQSAETSVSNVVKGIFEKTSYDNFNVTVVLGSNAVLMDTERKSLVASYPEKLSFNQHDGECSPSELNKYIEQSSSELCCLLTHDIELFNSDWLDVLVEGFKQDTKATIAGPTILSKDFDFVAASVRVKRKNGVLKEIFNARKIGGTGAVLAIHESCVLIDRKQFVKLGGFNSVFKLLRSAVVELCHRNTEDKKHNLLVANSEVMISNDSEIVELEALTKLL